MDVQIIIFDMDGVLVDVSRSYRQTIAQTVETYFVQGLGFQKPGRPLIDAEDIACFKEIEGFNNDWDLTAGLLIYLLSLTDLEPPEGERDPEGLDEALDRLRHAGRQSAMFLEDIHARKNLPEFRRKMSTYGTGLAAVAAAVGQKYCLLVLSRGSLDKTNIVKRIFQEAYLGSSFENIHHLPRRFHKGKGLHRQEKLLFSKELLESLERVVNLGIASGRPRQEAMLTLNRFHIGSCFKSLVTLEDIQKEEMRRFQFRGKREPLSKPHPFSILEAVRRISPCPVRSAYVGDLVDDIEAAHRARQQVDMVAIGYLSVYRSGRSRMRDLFRAHGADFVIESPEDLLDLVVRNDRRDGSVEE
jgi:HAD superfamily hydrolase (TIGR01548 family)